METALKIPVQMSVAEFLDWNPGGGERWQLVDGEPHAMAPARRMHRILQAALSAKIYPHLLAQGGRCSVVIEPGIVPRVRADQNIRIPDLAVTCSDPMVNEAVLTEPILVVEILSPSNQAETWSNVWTYTTITSITEIVVLRTAVIGADVLRRLPDGSWPVEPEKLSGGELVFDSIWLRIPLADLYVMTPLRLKPAAASAP